MLHVEALRMGVEKAEAAKDHYLHREYGQTALQRLSCRSNRASAARDGRPSPRPRRPNQKRNKLFRYLNVPSIATSSSAASEESKT